MGIISIVNIDSLKPIKDWIVSMKKTIPTTLAIETADITSGMKVGHLPMETYHVTKFLLDREARVFAILTSINYCISSVFQEGNKIMINSNNITILFLEIPCRIEIHIGTDGEK